MRGRIIRCRGAAHRRIGSNGVAIVESTVTLVSLVQLPIGLGLFVSIDG